MSLFLSSVCIAALIFCEIFTAAPQIVLFPQNVTTPLGENGTFSCNSSSSSIIWRLTGRNNDTTDIDVDRLQDFQEALSRFAERGIFFSGSRGASSYYSEITITGDLRNNFTQIQCAYAHPIIGDIDFSGGPEAFLRAFGPPSSPSDLRLSIVGNIMLQLSWSPSFSLFFVPVSYYVELGIGRLPTLRDNTTSAQISSAIPEDFCSTITLSVQAFNEAGGSNASFFASDMLTKPSVPASLHHSLKLQGGDIECTITFDPVLGCPEFPVIHYYLLLQEITPAGGNLSIVGPFQESSLTIIAPDIRENSEYSYRVRAVNSINISSETQEQVFLTTDVQSAIAVVRTSSSYVDVMCMFISGSQSKGCFVVLIVKNDIIKQHYVARNNISDTAKEEISIQNHDSFENLSILVFDWEMDGSLGSVATISDVLYANVSRVDDYSQYLPLMISVGGVILVLVILLAILIFCCVKVWRINKRQLSQKPAPASCIPPRNTAGPTQRQAGGRASDDEDRVDSATGEEPADSQYSQLFQSRTSLTTELESVYSHLGEQGRNYSSTRPTHPTVCPPSSPPQYSVISRTQPISLKNVSRMKPGTIV